MKKIKPIGSNVVVQIPKAEEMTKGGIFIPQTASKEKSQIGIVVAVGESEKINKQIKKETSVLYEKYYLNSLIKIKKHMQIWQFFLSG